MRYLPSILAVIAGGCGTSESNVMSLPTPQVMVIDLDGEKRSVPTNKLYDPETGEPAVAKVLVIDRLANRQAFVELDKLSASSPVGARYLLAAESPADPAPPPAPQP